MIEMGKNYKVIDYPAFNGLIVKTLFRVGLHYIRAEILHGQSKGREYLFLEDELELINE
jgi:hypothetical protein